MNHELVKTLATRRRGNRRLRLLRLDSHARRAPHYAESPQAPLIGGDESKPPLMRVQTLAHRLSQCG